MDNIGRKVTHGCCNPGSDDEVQEDTFSKRKFCLNTFIFLMLSVLVFLPFIAGLTLYSVVPKTQPYVFLINHNETNSEEVDMSILTAFPIHIPGSQDLGTTSGTIDLDLFIDSQTKLMGEILIINGTRPKCGSLLDDDDFYEKAVNANASGIILLDATPKSDWRVSSPYSGNWASLIMSQINQRKEHSQERSIPFLLIRESDWRKFDSHLIFLFENKRYLYIVWNNPSNLMLEDIFSCSNQNSLKIGAKTVKHN